MPALPTAPNRHEWAWFAAAISVWIAAHLPFISLPFFWDEAGYYLPAAHDLFATGSWIPRSVPSSGHPPLLSACLAGVWHLAGYSIPAARILPVLVSALGMWVVYRVALALDASRRTAWLAAICTSAHPTWFAQGSMILPDLPAAVFSLWGLALSRTGSHLAALPFTLGVLTKETAILVPAALLLVDIRSPERRRRHIVWTGIPLLALLLWYGVHRIQTGFVFGNPEFLQYNLTSNFSVGRFAVALLVRLWQLFGHMGMLVLTGGSVLFAAWNWWRRHRLDVPPQLFLAGCLVAVHVIGLSVVGGAALTRYLLPVLPVAIVLLLQWARGSLWLSVAALITFVGLWHAPLPYHFAMEENLTYTDFVRLHQDAAAFLETLGDEPVACAWPATFELTRPELGYVRKPLRVAEWKEAGAPELQRLRTEGQDPAVAFLFTRDYQPPDSPLRPRRLLQHLTWWRESSPRLGGMEAPVPPFPGKEILWHARHGVFEGTIVRLR